MKYSPEEVLQFVNEDDVKFIRLAFCDVYGRQKNIAIMSSELKAGDCIKAHRRSSAKNGG